MPNFQGKFYAKFLTLKIKSKFCLFLLTCFPFSYRIRIKTLKQAEAKTMRKRIEKEVNRKEVKQSNEVIGEKKMDTIESVYAKMSRRISYLKDRDTTSKLLDFQDALQEVMSEVIGKTIENPKYYIRRAVSNRMKNNRREISLENFGDTLEVKYSIDEGEVKEVKSISPALIVNSQGEIVTVIEAINRVLSPVEKIVFDFYTQGYTCKEIAVKVGSNEKSIQRQVKRIYDKIEVLKIPYFYNSHYATFQGKVGKAGDPKYNMEKKYNEKLNRYVDSEVVNPGEVINRKFVCLDQVKVKKQLLPDNYSGNMVVNRKEVIAEIADPIDPKKYRKVILNSQYMNSNLGPFTSNKEVIQLYYNRHEYNKMLRSNCTVVKENRYSIEFQTGRYISTDHKYKNLPA
jgi:DNA-directed RNA polymerase specialized sigma24 family protein